MKNNSKHLIVISLDGFGSTDVTNYLSFMPNLQKLIKVGTHIKHIHGVYPSQSYPSHVSMITGQLPDKHGIVNNQRFQINKKTPDWLWSSHLIKSPSLLQLAANKGLKVASLMWPVTEAANFIDYNLAPTYNEHIWNNWNQKTYSVKPLTWANKINREFKNLKENSESFQPMLDKFVTKTAADLILSKQPNVTMVRLTDLNGQRYRYGVHSTQANQSILRLDKRIGDIVKATVDAGIYNQTNFAIVSGGYMISVDKMIHLNMIFEEQGWLSTDKNEFINPDYQVIAYPSGGSTAIYVKDQRMIPEIVEVIEKSPVADAIETIYNQRQLKLIGADPKASLMLEAKTGYYFTNETNRPFLIEKVESRQYGLENRYIATDGYSPDKPMNTSIAVLSGPGIKKTNEIWQAEMIDIAPTLAEMIDVKFKNVIEGKTITGAFKTHHQVEDESGLYSIVKDRLDVAAVDPTELITQKELDKERKRIAKQTEKEAAAKKADAEQEKIRKQKVKAEKEKQKAKDKLEAQKAKAKADKQKTKQTKSKKPNQAVAKTNKKKIKPKDNFYTKIKNQLDVPAVDPNKDPRIKKSKKAKTKEPNRKNSPAKKK